MGIKMADICAYTDLVDTLKSFDSFQYLGNSVSNDISIIGSLVGHFVSKLYNNFHFLEIFGINMANLNTYKCAITNDFTYTHRPYSDHQLFWLYLAAILFPI